MPDLKFIQRRNRFFHVVLLSLCTLDSAMLHRGRGHSPYHPRMLRICPCINTRHLLSFLSGTAHCLREKKRLRYNSISETVIISYYRGTTHFDIMSTFACTIIHSRLITGSVPGGSYSDHFSPPSKVHSANDSILQSHHLQLSVISYRMPTTLSHRFLPLLW